MGTGENERNEKRTRGCGKWTVRTAIVEFLEIFHLDISLKIHSKASILVDTNESSSSCLAKDSFERRRRSEKLIRQTELFVRSKKIT